MDRISIGSGIWREGNQLVAIARVGSSRNGKQLRDRKTFKIGTDVSEIKAWQLRAKADLFDRAIARADESVVRGSLAADFEQYLSDLDAGRYKRDTVCILKHWSRSPLGSMERLAIQRTDVIAQLNRWIEAGVSVSARNKRLSRLRKVYEHFEKSGNPSPNPTDKIKFLKEPESEPRDVPIRIVKLILSSLPDLGRAEKGQTRPERSITKLALSVMAWTGMMPATLSRMTSRHFELHRKRAYFTPRRKGKGSGATWVKLLPPAIAALQAFKDAGLVGHTFSASSMGKTWRVGIERATAHAKAEALRGDRSYLDELDALPPNCRPQDLRHSFASEVYRETRDIQAVAELLQHASFQTTKRYTKGAVSETVSRAIDQSSAAFDVPTLAVPAAKKPAAKKKRDPLRIAS